MQNQFLDPTRVLKYKQMGNHILVAEGAYSLHKFIKKLFNKEAGVVKVKGEKFVKLSLTEFSQLATYYSTVNGVATPLVN